MFRKAALVLIIFFVVSGLSFGQETYFGQNKVQYRGFTWDYIQTMHFDIYFYNQNYDLAKFASGVLESSYVEISGQLNYRIHRRIPVFLYASPNDFQQTNIVPDLIDENVGGFTEAFKNRMVMPFDGSYEDFRHVLHHELTHAVVYDMLFGNMFSSLISRQRFFDLPLWFAEGYAEWSSRYGWDYYADMVVRDATINNYLAPPDYLGGYLAYKEGQAMIAYIVDNYGEQKLGEILAKGKLYLTMNKAMKASIGVTTEEFWKGFSKEMKRRYWPEIAKRREPGEISKALTNHEKDGSNFNEKPIFAPTGDKIAMFSDRSDYMGIYLISAVDGKILDRLVKGERTGDMESLHSYISGITFSPDGKNIAFVVKAKGKDALYFLTIKDKEIYKKQFFDFNSVQSPVWSPDGKKIAFAALNGPRRTIVIYDLEKNSTLELTNDNFDNVDPSWFPDSKTLAFTSDRPHPDNAFIVDNPHYKPADSVDFRTLYTKFGYGNYNLFSISIDSKEIKPLRVGVGQNREPAVSPDGKKICFVSNRNGIDNLYIAYADSTGSFAVTDILTGVGSPNWSPDGKQIAFSSFNKAGFDIFLLKDIKPAGIDGQLSPTDFIMDRYIKESEPVALKDSAVSVKDTLPGLLGKADSNSVADTTHHDTTSVAKAKPDSTRIEGGEYIYVAQEEKKKENPMGKIFEDLPDSTAEGKNYLTPAEVAAFDSVAKDNRLPNGDFKVHKYRVKFTPDYVSGGFSYDTFFGLRGQSAFVFSDYLGDHQIYLVTDLVNTIDQSNLQLFYLYNRLRTNFGFGIFHTKNYYIDNFDHLFSDRFYGFQGFLSRPFSKFSRVEFTGSQYFIDRKYLDDNDPRVGRSTKVAVGTLSYVRDNILWGITTPINGQRSRINISGATDILGGNGISFYSLDADWRRYWHLKGLFSTALRFSGGGSWGKNPKRYFLGGTTNSIGSVVVADNVYEPENLYFAEVVTPMRGFEYYELSGTRYLLSNLEFRYPFVEYLKLGFPLPMTLRYITGSLFYDMGATWDNDETFKGGSSQGGNHLQDIKSAFGFGVQANLGFLVLRYDLAWRTNFQTVVPHPKYYFSLGAGF